MTQMLDVKTGQPAEVPENAVADALATGLYAFAPGQRVNIVDDLGKTTSIDALELPKAFGAGFRIESAPEAQDRLFEKKYGEGIGNELKAGAEGVARGLSFGLSDQLLTKGGFATPEALRERKERNEGAAIGGELGGNLLPLLLSGGSSILGTGVKVAGSGVRGVAAAGRSVETAVAKALRGGMVPLEGAAANTVLERVAAKAAGSAVEGLAYGAGQTISEAALGDTELTAEKLLAGAGIGAVIGGSAAGLLHLGGEGISYAASKVAQGTKAGTTKLGESIGNLYRTATGNDPAKGLGDAYAKFSAVASGGDENAIRKFVKDKGARAIALSDETTLDNASRRLAEIENRSDELLDELSEKGRGIGKYEGIKDKVRADNADEVFMSSADIVGNIKSKLDDMELRAKEASEFDIGPVRKAKASLNKALAEMGTVGKNPNAKLFMQLDDLKRDIQKVTARAEKTSRTSSAALDTFKELNDIQNALRGHLEDEILWGAAGAAQKEVNAKWVPFLGNERYAGNNFATKVGESEFEAIYKHDSGRYLSFFRNVLSPSTDLDYQYLLKRQTARAELLDSLQRQFADDPAYAKKVVEARQLAKEARELMNRTKDEAVLKNQFRQLASGNDVLGAGAGSVGGYLLGGPVGALAGAVVGAASRPAQTIRQLAALDRMQSNISSRIKLGVSKYLNAARDKAEAVGRKASDAARRAGQRATRALAPLTVLQEAHFGDATQSRTVTDNRRDAAKQHAKDIALFVADPLRAADRIGRATAGIAAVAPNVAGAVGQKAMTAANFLASKAPKDPNPPNVLVKREWEPPKSELAKFARYVEAVQDPMSVLERMGEGTLTSESVEALKVVYPGLYQELAGEVVSQLSENPGKFNYADRVQLSLLLDQPLDPTMSPEFIAQAQQRWAVQPKEPQQAARVRVPGIEKFSLGEAMTPKTERVQEALG